MDAEARKQAFKDLHSALARLSANRDDIEAAEKIATSYVVGFNEGRHRATQPFRS